MSDSRNALGRRLVDAIGAENVVRAEYRDHMNIVVLLCEFGGERHHVRIIDVHGLENDYFVNPTPNDHPAGRMKASPTGTHSRAVEWLRAIRDLPSQKDLMFNPVAVAMNQMANRALQELLA